MLRILENLDEVIIPTTVYDYSVITTVKYRMK